MRTIQYTLHYAAPYGYRAATVQGCTVTVYRSKYTYASTCNTHRAACTVARKWCGVHTYTLRRTVHSTTYTATCGTRLRVRGMVVRHGGIVVHYARNAHNAHAHARANSSRHGYCVACKAVHHA